MKHTDSDRLNIFICSKTSFSLTYILYIVLIKIIVTSIRSRSSIIFAARLSIYIKYTKKSNKWIKQILSGFFINYSYRRINPKKLVFHNLFSFASINWICSKNAINQDRNQHSFYFWIMKSDYFCNEWSWKNFFWIWRQKKIHWI